MSAPASDAELTYEQLDDMVEQDPIATRDRVWAEIQKLRRERAKLAHWAGVDLSELWEMNL